MHFQFSEQDMQFDFKLQNITPFSEIILHVCNLSCVSSFIVRYFNKRARGNRCYDLEFQARDTDIHDYIFKLNTTRIRRYLLCVAFTHLFVLFNIRTPGFEIEKSLSFSGVGIGLLEFSYITLYIIRIKT